MAQMDTRLAHETHRFGTGLLAEAAERPSVPFAALAQLRDFLVANLRHHHETEDTLLWPRLVAVEPDLAKEFESLSAEHERLDAALERLDAVALDADGSDPEDADGSDPEDADGRVRAELRAAAEAVRDSVLEHLAHEEPVLFPVLREHMGAAEWDDFSRQVIAGTPPVAQHLMIGFLDEVGTPAEVELMLKGLPEQARPLVPAMRQQGADEIRVLRGGAA